MVSTDKILRTMVETIEGYAQKMSVKTAFWQEGKCWHSYTFDLKSNKKLRENDKQFLESIRENDPRTVVIDSADYKKTDDDGLLVNAMVADIAVFYNTRRANISDFLEEYADKEAQQYVMTIKEIVKIMEKRLKQLADYECFELSNGNSTSTEMLEIAKFLIKAKQRGLDVEE